MQSDVLDWRSRLSDYKCVYPRDSDLGAAQKQGFIVTTVSLGLRSVS